MSIDSVTSESAAVLTAVQDARRAGSATLPEPIAKQLLRDHGIAVPSGTWLASDAAPTPDVRGPLVLKAVSPTLIHKSDAGGVVLGLEPGQVAEAAQSMRQHLAEQGHEVAGFLLEEMAAPGQEFVVGAVRTPGVGWAVMIGLGGVFVEVLEDVAFGLAPLSRSQVNEMLDELKGKALLLGARGGQAVDLEALIDVVMNIAGPDGLLTHLPEDITEMDLNPIIASASGAVAVDARFVLGPVASATQHVAEATNVEHDFARLFAPDVIAVLGASARGANGANLFIRNLQKFGFTGKIVPIHPSADVIEGLRVAASLGAVDSTIDYAYVALPAARVAPALAAGQGNVRFAQVISSGFGETPEGEDLERELVAVAQASGIRVIGPNCLGMHSTKACVSFLPDAPATPGSVAVVSQSGGLSVDILRLGESRGIAFSSVTSIGNGADVGAADLLQFHLDDPSTSVVGMYLESLADGRAVLDLLSQRSSSKPVVLLAGGRSAAGSRAASSHTGALSGNHRLWPALARQSGALLVESLEQFVDTLQTFELAASTPSVMSNEIILFGNGGGASVLAADSVERVSLMTPGVSAQTLADLDALNLPPGNGLANPIDTPGSTLLVGGGTVAGDILDVVLRHERPAAIVSHFNVGILLRNLPPGVGDVTSVVIDSIARARDASAHVCHHLLVLKSDGSVETDAQIRKYRAQARAHGIAVFGDINSASLALRSLLQHQTFQAALPGRGA